MGLRGPGAGAGSGGGGGLGRRQRPRRPHRRAAGGEERSGGGDGAGEGAARSAEEGRDGPRRRRPVRERRGACAARQAASCAPGPRARCCCCCCCCCRPPPASAPAAPASSGHRARPAPWGARSRRVWASRRLQWPRRPAAGCRAPASRIPTRRAGLGAAVLGGCSASPAMRRTCSSAGPQPTLGRRSPGETNPSAARRASGPARSPQPPAAPRRRRRRRRRRPKRVKLRRTAPLSPPRAGGWGRSGRPRRVRSDPPPRDPASEQRIGNHAPAPCPAERGEQTRETASGAPGDADPGPRASPGGCGWRTKRYTEETAESRGCIETGSPWGLVPTRVLCTDTVNKLFLMAVMRLSPLSAITLRLSP
ncbi:uncharacterized protein LOC141580507 [Saimiri boliviensis]|uniref:uncharacterized protein LOC141580507 n=1 Tax=Saimiri boliviensis TaxID=27679 RepID=UPI003D789D91